uniref:Doublecortin domain-containing protein n=1 Tax=Parascaris univalens TaxID=6257 RepID=A0A915BWM0_PARUN
MQSGKPPSFGSKPSGDSGIEMDSTPQVDFNYRGMKVTIFKNGEAHDIGTTVVVSRWQFKHWITFLDHLSRKLNMLAPVHKIFTTDGLPIRQFESLQNGGHYVAVSQGPFIPIKYGTAIVEGEKEKRWNTDPHVVIKDVSSLDSAESVDIYLKKCGYGSRTGLPFPFDGVRVFRPHQDLPQIPLSSSAPRTLALDRGMKAAPDSDDEEKDDKKISNDKEAALKSSEEEPIQEKSKPIAQRRLYDPDFVDFDFFPNIMF